MEFNLPFLPYGGPVCGPLVTHVTTPQSVSLNVTANCPHIGTGLPFSVPGTRRQDRFTSRTAASSRRGKPLGLLHSGFADPAVLEHIDLEDDRALLRRHGAKRWVFRLRQQAAAYPTSAPCAGIGAGCWTGGGGAVGLTVVVCWIALVGGASGVIAMSISGGGDERRRGFDLRRRRRRRLVLLRRVFDHAGLDGPEHDIDDLMGKTGVQQPEHPDMQSNDDCMSGCSGC